jgi:hypothetical protein
MICLAAIYFYLIHPIGAFPLDTGKFLHKLMMFERDAMKHGTNL